ncbi:MAG: methyltransferase [Ignavibacteria bacterium]|nr:methyltransferase [Ignavibacteria bacterium]
MSLDVTVQTAEINFKKYPVPRVRHHSNPQVYLPAHQAQKDLEWYPPVIAQPSWDEFFQNGRSADVLDIGCGRGGFLLSHALNHPEMNILGVEVRNMLVDWTNKVIAGENIPNAHVVWYSMANGLQWIPSNSINYATYLFPDPWPKRRHKKRRAFTLEFLDELSRVLKPNGKLYLATDRPEVASHQHELIDESVTFELVDVITEPLLENSWPFIFKTDQQRFSERKGIPYTYSIASNVRQ